jgi:transcriptional antiterminator Rof (Rho-off)
MFNVVITLTDEQGQRVEARAAELGYSSPREYLHAVIEDVLEEEDDSDEEILASLERSLQQMQRGEVLTVAELWRRLESDDNA